MDALEHSWLRRIANDPGDESSWLVYADWLEERCDRRSELVRLQVADRAAGEDHSLQKLELRRQKLRLLQDGAIELPLANCIDPPETDPLLRKTMQLGIPLSRGDQTEIEPGLARQICSQFDFTNGLGMRFHLLPAGRFWMGSPLSEANRHPSERRHHVLLTRPFFLGVFPVLQREFQQQLGHNPSKYAPGGTRGDAVQTKDAELMPVDSISWDAAVGFCESLSKQEGLPYCLPSEAQWEYACRAGTNTVGWFGDSMNEVRQYAVCGRFWPDETPEACRGLRSNPWGLCDMLGNVSEWCGDSFRAYPETDVAVVDPTGPAAGQYKVSRGEHCFVLPQHCRSASRTGFNPDDTHDFQGFRVAVTVAPPDD